MWSMSILPLESLVIIRLLIGDCLWFLGVTREILVLQAMGILPEISILLNKFCIRVVTVCDKARDKSSIELAEISAIKPLLISLVCIETLLVSTSIGLLLVSPLVDRLVEWGIWSLHIGQVLAVVSHCNKGRYLKI